MRSMLAVPVTVALIFGASVYVDGRALSARAPAPAAAPVDEAPQQASLPDPVSADSPIDALDPDALAPAAVEQTAPCTNVVGPAAPPPATVATGIAGYHAAWYGQSGLPMICPGTFALLTVGYLNSGSLGWVAGQTPLAIGTWDPDPGQDQPSALGGDGSTGTQATDWPLPNRVALQSAPYVGPGQVAWLQFKVKAPAQPGVYRLSVRPVIDGVQWLEDQGVFWYVVVKADDSNIPPLPVPPPPPPPRTYYPSLNAGVRSIKVSSLMYHYISPLPAGADRFRVDLTVNPWDFEEHLKYLKAQGYVSITSSELWWTLDQGGALPAKPIQLTFDDGYADAYTYAFPLLKKYGMVGTFFITTNLVGRAGYLTRAQVREMADAGMDMQSHAVDHVSINLLPFDRQLLQACESRRILGEMTGKDIRHFAYPAGDNSAQAMAALMRCGYLTAYWKAGGSLQSSDRMMLLYRARVRGQQGLSALLTALRE